MFGKIALGAAAMTTAATGGFAATQGGTVQGMMQGHPHMQGRNVPHEDVMAAIEANDFDAWVNAVTSNDNNPLADHATEAVFDQMTAMHDLMESGDRDAAQTIHEELRTELGLPEPPPRGAGHMGMGRGVRPHMILDAETRASLDQAIADKNFDAWATILIEAGAPEERVTQDHFERMVDHYATRQSRAEA